MGDVEHLKSFFVTHPDFPVKGINFVDWLPVLRNPIAFETLITHIVNHITANSLVWSPSKKIDVVVALEARGFLFGPTVALRLGAAFVPVRKKGKLPGECFTSTYLKEYGEDHFQMQAGAIQPGQNVIVLDDLLATGGSAQAAGALIAQQGGITLEYIFIVELSFYKGRDKLDAPVYAMIRSDEEPRDA